MFGLVAATLVAHAASIVEAHNRGERPIPIPMPERKPEPDYSPLWLAVAIFIGASI